MAADSNGSDQEIATSILKRSSRSLSPVGSRRVARIEKENKEPLFGSRLHSDVQLTMHHDALSLRPSSSSGINPQQDNQHRKKGGEEGTMMVGLDDHTASRTTDPLQRVNNNSRSRYLEEENSLSSSSSSSSAESLANAEDMKYSLSSNLLFLVGASIQTSVAIWDVVDAGQPGDDDKNTANEVMDDVMDHDALISRIYAVLNSAGPFLYILNAFVDAKFALALPPIADGEEEVRGRLSSIFRGLPYWGDVTWEEGTHLDIDIAGKLWDFASAIAFGLGASLEFYSTFFDDDDDNAVHAKGFYLTGYKLNMISMHTYLISGLLAVHKDRSLVCYPGGSLARRLMACGMILFLMGSILDCLISYLYDPELVSDNVLSELTLSWCNLSSTLLWNVDAIFYVLADFLLYSVHTKLSRLCHSGWVLTRQRIWCNRDRIGLLELPSTMSAPLVGPRLSKVGHSV